MGSVQILRNIWTLHVTSKKCPSLVRTLFASAFRLIGSSRGFVFCNLFDFHLICFLSACRKYNLRKVMVNGDIPPKVKKDAHAVILEFIRSRPPLRKVSRTCFASLITSRPKLTTSRTGELICFLVFVFSFCVCFVNRQLIGRWHL